jgi:hypothetical protein
VIALQVKTRRTRDRTVACLAMEASSRSPDQDFRLDAVVEAEALHNQHGVSVTEAHVVWGWQGIVVEGVGGGSSSTRRLCLWHRCLSLSTKEN